MSYRLTVYVSSLIDLHSAKKKKDQKRAYIYIYTYGKSIAIARRFVLRYLSFLWSRGMERVL